MVLGREERSRGLGFAHCQNPEAVCRALRHSLYDYVQDWKSSGYQSRKGTEYDLSLDYGAPDDSWLRRICREPTWLPTVLTSIVGQDLRGNR